MEESEEEETPLISWKECQQAMKKVISYLGQSDEMSSELLTIGFTLQMEMEKNILKSKRIQTTLDSFLKEV